MLRQRKRGFLGRVGHAFRRRQIYLRSGSDVQYITLKPWMQVLSLIVLCAALFWTAFATVNIAFKDQLLLLKERRMHQARLDFEDRIARMRGEFDKLNDKLLLDQGAYLAKVDEVRLEHARLMRLHERVVSFFKQGWFPLRDTEEAAAPPPSNKAGFNDRPFTDKYADAFRDAADAAAPLAELRRQFAAYEDMKVALLEEAVKYSEARLAQASALLNGLGIGMATPEAAVAEAKDVGGPFIAVDFAKDESPRALAPMLAVARNADSYERIKTAAGALPLFSPLKSAERLTSSFGFRVDPFRNTLGFHAGIDFKGPYGEEVLATSDGVVAAAGWDGGYGKMIEIVHDNGVATRYGHLSWIAVSPGQRVKRGDIVGRLGNTGRSTGPHLHYETRVKGRAIDPVRFWRTRDDLQALSKND